MVICLKPCREQTQQPLHLGSWPYMWPTVLGVQTSCPREVEHRLVASPCNKMPLELHASHLLLYQMNIAIDVHVPQKSYKSICYRFFFFTRIDYLYLFQCWYLIWVWLMVSIFPVRMESGSRQGVLRLLITRVTCSNITMETNSLSNPDRLAPLLALLVWKKKKSIKLYLNVTI